jgi:hypothetical protein
VSRSALIQYVFQISAHKFAAQYYTRILETNDILQYMYGEVERPVRPTFKNYSKGFWFFEMVSTTNPAQRAPPQSSPRPAFFPLRPAFSRALRAAFPPRRAAYRRGTRRHSSSPGDGPLSFTHIRDFKYDGTPLSGLP